MTPILHPERAAELAPFREAVKDILLNDPKTPTSVLIGMFPHVNRHTVTYWRWRWGVRRPLARETLDSAITPLTILLSEINRKLDVLIDTLCMADKLDSRSFKISIARQQGKTLASIAKEFGISKERVRQILGRIEEVRE